MRNSWQTRHSPIERIIASLGIALVLALTVLAASPDLHERLHGHELGTTATAHHDGSRSIPAHPVDDEDGCVVTLFAQGLVLPLALVALAFTGQTLRLLDFAIADSVGPEAPRYLRLPTQAPPLLG
jgi:hypothetical protein